MIPLESIPIRAITPGALSLSTVRTVQQDARGLFVVFHGYAFRAPEMSVHADFEEVEVSFCAASADQVHPRALEVRRHGAAGAETWACDESMPKRRYPQQRKESQHEEQD